MPAFLAPCVGTWEPKYRHLVACSKVRQKKLQYHPFSAVQNEGAWTEGAVIPIMAIPYISALLCLRKPAVRGWAVGIPKRSIRDYLCKEMLHIHHGAGKGPRSGQFTT